MKKYLQNIWEEIATIINIKKNYVLKNMFLYVTNKEMARPRNTV